MKAFVVLFVAVQFLTLSVRGQGSTNTTFISEQIALIPPCGLGCLVITAPQVGCSVFDTACQCQSHDLTAMAMNCMLTNCTLEEALGLSRASAAICERPYESRNRDLVLTTISCSVIAYSAVVARLSFRYYLGQNFGMDDLFITLGMGTGIAWTYYGVMFEKHGFGNHIWTIDPAMIKSLLFWFFICETIYSLNINFVKMSILYFYLRVFPRQGFRKACYAVMAVVGAYCLVSVLVTVFQCTPVAYAYDKSLRGTCINYNSASWANAGVNIVQDVAILVLPIQELRVLRLSRRKKIQMYMMFSIGIVVVITSCIRLQSLHGFGLTTDPTWDNVATAMWSTIESTTAVCCACLPMIRAGLSKLFPRFLEVTIHSSKSRTSSAVTKAQDWSSGSKSGKAADNSAPHPRTSVRNDGDQEMLTMQTSNRRFSHGRASPFAMRSPTPDLESGNLEDRSCHSAESTIGPLPSERTHRPWLRQTPIANVPDVIDPSLPAWGGGSK